MKTRQRSLWLSSSHPRQYVRRKSNVKSIVMTYYYCVITTLLFLIRMHPIQSFQLVPKGKIVMNIRYPHRLPSLQIIKMQPESRQENDNSKDQINNSNIGLQESKGNKKNGLETSVSDDMFDGAGFANYLAPYALAFVASLLVTFAFFKFVLLDY